MLCEAALLGLCVLKAQLKKLFYALKGITVLRGQGIRRILSFISAQKEGTVMRVHRLLIRCCLPVLVDPVSVL